MYDVEDLLHAADMFQVVALKNFITTYLINNIDKDNVLQLYVLGWKYNIELVYEKTSMIISNKLPILIQNEDFLHMDVQYLKVLVSNTYIHKKDVCEAISKWLQ